MAYTVIKGEFHIHYPETPRNGPEPDGDTIKFKPDNRALVENLPRANRPAKFNQKGITTLRFEGVDALETHFRIEGENYHQHMELALAARNQMLATCGFGQVNYFADSPFKVERVEHHPVRGYILTNGLDTYGRVIAFLFVGDHPGTDGTSLFVEPAMLNDSINVDLLRTGLVYPAFYLSLPVELRNHLREITVQARQTNLGVWPQATATMQRAATIRSRTELEEAVIWPKLFRRLAAYFSDGFTELSGFETWLREDPVDRDDRLLLPNLELGNMHDLISVCGDSLKLNFNTQDVVVVPDDYVLPQPPKADRHNHIGAGQLRVVAALVDAEGSNEVGGESVTFINTTSTAIDLDGIRLTDNQGGMVLNGTLRAGDTLRLTLPGSVRLNNTGDTITLLDNDNHIIDQVSYTQKDLTGEGFTITF